MEILLDAGASYGIPNSKGETALDIAARDSDIDTQKVFAKYVLRSRFGVFESYQSAVSSKLSIKFPFDQSPTGLFKTILDSVDLVYCELHKLEKSGLDSGWMPCWTTSRFLILKI